MTSRRSFHGDQNMYGGRSARPVDSREGIPLSHLSMMPRRQNVYGGADDNNRGGRGKATADEDTRVGSNRGELRVSAFLGGGKSRGSIDHADHHRSDDTTSYAAISERRAFRDDGILKMVRGADEAPLRGEGGVRFRDGNSRRGERVVRPATYSDDAKWIMKGFDNNPSYDGGIGSLRDSDYLPVTKPTSSNSAILPGFIFECHKRTILEFSSHKGSFILPFIDRRLTEQVGPGTKIFMFDNVAREIHGVFQAESYPVIDLDANPLRVSEGSAFRVRVRVAKDCIPLTERQFKEILHENYYTNSKFTENLTKEQVMKLLHIFRPADPARSAHVSLPSSRRTVDPGLSNSSQDFHSISDEIVYRKEERWRRGTVDARSLSGHSYHSQDAFRFPSKLPAPPLSTKALDDYEDYGDDEVIEDIPLSTPRLITNSNPYSSSRGKQQALRGLSGSRSGVSHIVGTVGHSELKLADVDWREDIDPRDLVYRKRQHLSVSPVDELKRGGRSSSPPWKDVHTRIDAGVGEMYDRPGKGGYKEDSSFTVSRRRRHNDIDLNVPLETGHGEPAHVHDVESKAVRRMVWDDEEEKEYSISPPKGRSLLPRSSSFHIPDHLLSSSVVDDYEDERLDSRHMVNVTRKDYPLLRTVEKSRPVSSSYSPGKFGKPHPRAGPVVKNYSKEKPVLNPNPIIRKRPVVGRDLYNKESTSRGSKVPVFQIKANLQAPGRGKPERVVTMVDKDNFCPWGSGSGEGFDNGNSASQGRKRKASVWSRITLPGKGPWHKGTATHGRGRVFSRLGPSSNTSFEHRDDTYGYKSKKPWQQQAHFEANSERFESIENSPDALEGEDYLNDDLAVSEQSEQEMEKAAGDLQGWTRKKTSVVNSGDEGGVPDHGDYANGKGGRRKLVRPSIGTKGEADENEWKQPEPAHNVTMGDAETTPVQPRSHSGSMDMEMANMETREVEDVDSPLGSQHDLNSVEDDIPDFEEDNMISS